MEALIKVPDGKVKLKAEVNREGRPELSVTDNGMGISEEIKDQVFVPFFTTKEAGSGIGLSLSRQIMQMHGAA